MSALSAAGYIFAALGALAGLAILFVAGWIVLRSGVVKGLKEAAEGWEKRADLLARNLDDAHTSATAAATLAAETAAAIAEQHRTELSEVRDELSKARERIAVLEAATDLSAVQNALEQQGHEAALVRAELEAQKAVVSEALSDHNAEAHDRHERIVAALEAITDRLETSA